MRGELRVSPGTVMRLKFTQAKTRRGNYVTHGSSGGAIAVCFRLKAFACIVWPGRIVQGAPWPVCKSCDEPSSIAFMFDVRLPQSQ
jgi:hypothetical protein